MYVNYYFYVLIIYIPLAIFLGKPEDKAWVRILRLISLVVLGYVLINLALHFDHNHEHEIYEECLKKFDDKNFAVYNCRGIIVGKRAENVFYLFLGWIPVMGYIGFWELIWRRVHRREIRQLGRKFRGKWLGNIAIGFFCLCFSYTLLVAVAVVCGYFDCKL